MKPRSRSTTTSLSSSFANLIAGVASPAPSPSKPPSSPIILRSERTLTMSAKTSKKFLSLRKKQPKVTVLSDQVN